MTTRIRSSVTLAALAAAALALASCSATPESVETTSAPVDAPEVSSSPVATTEPTPGDAAPATCESLLPESVLAEFAEAKWTAKEDVFRVGSLVFDEGIQCVWGDYTVASDHVQVFGWAPATDDEAETARDELLAAGWQTVDGDFVTENTDHVLNPDADGYGMTYEFGDGWITLADTKQSLLLIERPAS